jgi:hypothetical protein
MLSQKSSFNLVLLLAIAAFLTPIIWIEHDILQSTHGSFAYPLDESFLQMTIAKNLAFEHVWGITKYSFISASSSPLYTLILAIVFLVTGAYPIVPLLLNGLIAILFLRDLQKWLIRQGLTARAQLLILLAVIFLIPLPLLVISGMEYTLQLFFSFLFIAHFSGAATREVLPRKVYLYGILMVTTSYESIPILLIACILLLTRRQSWSAFKLFFLSLLPIYLFGLASLNKHNYFVPNPILLTRGIPDLKSIWQDLPFILTIALICFLFLDIFRQKLRRSWLVYPLLLLAIPIALRSFIGFSRAAPACISFYNQQYQAAKFLRAYYSNERVASNNIGAVSFCSDHENVMDLAGIGDLEVLKNIRMHSWTPALADSFAERSNVKIAVLHHSWTDKDTDPYWYKIASWHTTNDSVSFYSINWGGVNQLQKTLHAYEPRLPSGVTVHYYPATR